MSINKTQLIKLVVRKFRGQIKRKHIRSVLQIFIDELKREIYGERPVVIGNFATFQIKQLKSKPVLIAKTKRFKQARESHSLRIRLARSLAKLVRQQ